MITRATAAIKKIIRGIILRLRYARIIRHHCNITQLYKTPLICQMTYKRHIGLRPPIALRAHTEMNRLLHALLGRLGLMLNAFDPKDPADAKALQDAIDAAVAPLLSKNRELLDELKTARKGKTIDPADVEKLEAQIDKLTEERDTALKASKDATKAAETATKALTAESGFTQRLLIDNGLVSELTKNGVTNPAHLKAAQAMLRAGVTIKVDGENRIAQVGDKALADSVKEWAASDEGKNFVSAAGSSGGGAPGGGGAAGADLMKLSPQARMDAGRAGVKK